MQTFTYRSSLVAILFTVGCSHKIDKQSDPFVDQVMSHLQEMHNQYYFGKCEDLKVSGDRCGLISQEPENQIEYFNADYCKKFKIGSKKCASEWLDSMFAKFKTRYTYADRNNVDLWCSANRKQCTNIGLVEIEYIKDHDRNLEAAMELYRQKALAIHAQSQIDYADRLLAQRRAEEAKKLNCVSSSGYNGNVYTSCH